MVSSLNQLSEILAERSGRQFDIPFREEMKVVINYWRSRLVVDSLNSRPADRMFFTKWIEIPLIQVPRSEFPGFPECEVILRTKCKVPKTVRANSKMYDFVGKLDRMDAVQLRTPSEIQALSHSTYTGHLPRASEINEYVYVFGTLNLPGLAFQLIPEDVEEFKQCCIDCGASSCYNDDEPYPVSLDIQQRIIQSILSTELRNILPSETKAAEVSITEPVRN
jgi:hypothetical protein